MLLKQLSLRQDLGGCHDESGRGLRAVDREDTFGDALLNDRAECRDGVPVRLLVRPVVKLAIRRVVKVSQKLLLPVDVGDVDFRHPQESLDCPQAGCMGYLGYRLDRPGHDLRHHCPKNVLLGTKVQVECALRHAGRTYDVADGGAGESLGGDEAPGGGEEFGASLSRWQLAVASRGNRLRDGRKRIRIMESD